MAIKLSKAVIAQITKAMFSAASATNAWAGASAEYRQGKVEKGSYVRYFYRDYLLGLVQTAEITDGYTCRLNERRTPSIELCEALPAMSTSVMHHEVIRTNMYSTEVRSIETQLVACLRPIVQYIDIYLGEYEDTIYGCRRRELIVRVKAEFRKQVPLTLSHTLLDKDLLETRASMKVRNERAVFND